MDKQRGIAPVVIVILIAVGIGAYLLYQNQNKTTPAPVQQTTPISTDKTANWKTYTNTKYGFEIKYPSTLDYAACSTSSIYFDPAPVKTCDSDAVGIIHIYVNDNIQSPLINVSEEFKVVNKKTINIDRKQGERVLVEKVEPAPGADKIIVVAVVHNGKTYTFNLQDINSEQIFDQILSTFKFTK